MNLFNTHRLARDLKSMVQDLDDLLETTAGNAGDALSDTRKRIATSLHDAKSTLTSLEKQMAKDVKVAARATDRYVHDNPWRTVGVAAGIGVIIGLLIGRRDR